jgi:MFS family permease
VSLRYRDFRLVWLGSVTEHVGEFMETAAVFWLVNQLTHSPLMLTVIGSARFAPMVLFPIVGGIVADRINRRNLLVMSLVGSGLLSLFLSIFTWMELTQVWHIIVVCLLSGVAMSFNHPARQAILPNLVEKDHLLNAVSMDFFSVQGARMAGMAIAGYLILAVGLWPIFLLRTVGCAMAIFWLGLAHVPPTPVTSQGKTSRQNLMEGFGYLRSNSTVLILVILYLIPWLTGNTFASFLPVVCSDVLRVGAVGYGYLQASPGVGSLIALVALTFFTYSRRKPTLLVGSGLVMGLGLIAFASSIWVPLSYFSLVVVGAMQMVFTAVNTTVIQGMVHDQFRGRIMSWREVAFGLGPTGSIVFGAIAQITGVQISMGILGAATLVPMLLVLPLIPRMNKHQV